MLLTASRRLMIVLTTALLPALLAAAAPSYPAEAPARAAFTRAVRMA